MKKIYVLLLSAFSFIMLSGCNDWIELEPGPPAEKGEMVKTSIPADLNGTEQLSIRITCSKKPGAQIGIDEIAFIPLKADINVAL